METKYPIWIACVGNATDPDTFSGIPFHLLKAGIASGSFAGGLNLQLGSGGIAWRRRLWNLGAPFRYGGFGGYQYSDSFLSRIWDARVPRGECDILNLFQLYPEKVYRDPVIRKWFYIDQTLRQLFDQYGVRVSANMKRYAMARERTQYNHARGVICHTQWAAQSVVHDYGVPSRRVHVVGCGANLDLEHLTRIGPRSAQSEKGPLKLVFVGKDWQRKGLDRLLKALKQARSWGAKIELHVVGACQSDLPRSLAVTDGVIWHGFVDKRKDMRRFLEIVTACDVGCLLSRAEAGGISLLEFASLGLPTIAPDVGGSPEFAAAGASILVRPEDTDEQIGTQLLELSSNKALMASYCERARSDRSVASWSQVVDRISNIMK